MSNTDNPYQDFPGDGSSEIELHHDGIFKWSDRHTLWSLVLIASFLVLSAIVINVVG